MNNLKQIGLAIQSHVTTMRHFPHAGTDPYDNSVPTYQGPGQPTVGLLQRAGWAFQILPYLEADNVFRGGGGASIQECAVNAIGTPHKVFFCPSRRLPMTIVYTAAHGGTWYNNVLALPHTGRSVTAFPSAMIDYAGSNIETVGGNNRSTGILQPSTYRTTAGGSTPNPNAPIRPRDVSDGLSNTLVVAEKAMFLAQLGQLQPDDDQGYTVGFDHDTMRHTDQPPIPDYKDPNPGGTSYAAGAFGSSHPMTFQAVFGDGSVHAIPYTINPTVFQYLGNISDGHPIDGTGF